MKLTDQSVPPEFVDQLADVLSVLPSAPGVPFTARTRRRALQPSTTYTVRQSLSDLAAAVDYLCEKMEFEPDSPQRADFRYARLRELLTGDINTDYWQPLTRTSRTILTSTPSSIPDPSPPPYSYRDPANLPTLPTWPAATVSGTSPAYAGATAGGYFADTSASWSRSIYTLKAPITADDRPPVIARAVCNISITTDKRASRPMLSILTTHQFAPTGALNPADTTPPFDTPRSYYWRYEIPDSPAPYFSLTYQRTILSPLWPSASELLSVPLTDVAYTLLPRPMFGRGWNNNTTVTITLADTIELYQVRPCALLRGNVDFDLIQFTTTPTTHTPYTGKAPAQQSLIDYMRVLLLRIPVIPPWQASGPPIGEAFITSIFNDPPFPRMNVRATYLFPLTGGGSTWFDTNQVSMLSAC